ncbi:hypothetical protein [Burkholderia sp. NRF60-BP8]|uniref:hypothetical protein n=1 Tax=Burkholderia sp. NRF60-BP8 TaxID=1637853 RepID=UPI00131ED27D|nr:hypothetical protein [Burkholderia sp. NRF60-BP8]
MHAVVRNEPDYPDGTESRALTSPQSTAKRIPWQVGDSCLQHDTLRFGLFSFSCPRLRYVRPTEAIAEPTAPAIALTAHTTMQGAHHASCRKASRAAGRHRTPSESANVSKLKRIAGIVASSPCAVRRPPDNRPAAGIVIGLERPASPVPTIRHRPAGTRTRRMSDTKHRLDIGSRTPACRSGRDDRAPQCVASRPPLAPHGATLRVG